MFVNIWVSTFTLATLVLSQGSLGNSQYGCRNNDWEYKGCYSHAGLHDGAFNWHLSTSVMSHAYPGYQRGSDMTLDLCLTACRVHGFRFSSLSNGTDCYCQTQLPAISQTWDSDSKDNSTINTCHVAPAMVHGCAGNKNEWCGSASGADVYEDPSFSQHSSAGDVSNYEHLGCFTYAPPGAWQIQTTTRSMDTCMAYCGHHGFAYAFGISPDGEPDNCGCGTEVQAGLRANSEFQCSAKCNAKSESMCGGEYHVSAYLNDELQGCFAPNVPGTKLGSSSHAPEVENQVALAKRDATDPAIAPPYEFVSCWSDSDASRTLRYQLTTSALGGDDNQTVENCAYTCNSYGYAYMGVEYFYQCFCDNAVQGNAAADFSNCNTPCKGNSAEQCGGPNFLSLYKLAPDTGSYSSDSSSSTTMSSTTTDTSTSSDTSTSLPAAAYTTSTPPPGTVTVTTTLDQVTTTQAAITVTATATETPPAATVTATATATTTVQGTVTQTATTTVTATYTPSPVQPTTVTVTPSAVSVASTSSTTTTMASSVLSSSIPSSSTTSSLSLPIYSTTARVGTDSDTSTSTTTSISVVYVTPVPVSSPTSLPTSAPSSDTLSVPGYSSLGGTSSTCPARTPSTVYTTVIATMTMTG